MLYRTRKTYLLTLYSPYRRTSNLKCRALSATDFVCNFQSWPVDQYFHWRSLIQAEQSYVRHVNMWKTTARDRCFIEVQKARFRLCFVNIFHSPATPSNFHRSCCAPGSSMRNQRALSVWVNSITPVGRYTCFGCT